MLSRSYQTLPPPPPYDRLLAQRELERIVLRDASNQGGSTYCLLPAALAGIFGAGSLQMVYADYVEGVEGPVPSPSGGRDLEQRAKDERARVTNMLRSKGQPHGSIPRFSVSMIGHQMCLKFQVPPACEVSQLIAVLVSKLGVNREEPSGDSYMLVRGSGSTFGWQLTLYPLERSKNAKEGDSNPSISKADGDLCISMFRSLISKDEAEIWFLKSGSLSEEELEAFVSVLQTRRVGNAETWIRFGLMENLLCDVSFKVNISSGERAPSEIALHSEVYRDRIRLTSCLMGIEMVVKMGVTSLAFHGLR
ncbi:hypothetical protein MLD38_039292 [Melastoma candidum]|uniref:Uncharacterized protein n=1 Tax=Melastoma candidum TaxID=119954 RepID=A0ACB9L221_9MYRT|nr:hypothetical protein MLD38_039292 [Melastoma candidum]